MVGNTKKWLAVGGAAVLLLSVAACGSNKDSGGGSGGPGASKSAGDAIKIGTTDSVTALDPAGSYDQGSSTLEYNLYQTLLTIPAGENTPQGDAAQSCQYDDPQTFTCKLRPGLKFSNGDDLTSSDVKFSLERAINIADPNGAAIYLLGSIGKPNKDGVLQVVPSAIETPDDATVVFHLNKPDTTFQFVLTYPGAGAIVDEDVFPKDKELADDQVIGSGPYSLVDYKPGEEAVFEINGEYGGDNVGTAPQVFVSYYTEPSALKLAVEDGDVDVAWRSLSPTDLSDLKDGGKVTVASGDGSEIRYWVWDVSSPVGKELATRQAAAQIIDRDAIAKTAYEGTVTPLYSIVPPGFPGQVDAFQEKFGDANVDAAKKLLSDAGVKTPVDITVGYTPTHYGPNAVDEATELQRQLEESGLFKVSLKSAEWE
ncbi:MAG: ABC transporter substrate-binding protein, partial [Nocardioidaceae bacterium]